MPDTLAESKAEVVPNIVSKTVEYTCDGTVLKGEIYFDKNSSEKHPAIMVVPEWWGNNNYPKKRARLLALMGYTAFAIDMYGDGLVVNTPDEAQEQSGKIYANPELLKARVQAAYDLLIKEPSVDPEHIAAIGYCFGGTVCLNAASMGIPLDAVVSFHGGLSGVSVTEQIDKASVLICHGGADPFVPQEDVDAFKAQMGKVNADYTFKVYEGATHAFTNKSSTATGEKFGLPISYNAEADHASWEDMQTFFTKNFPAKKS